MDILSTQKISNISQDKRSDRDVLFEFHLKFWNTTSIVFVFQLVVYYKVDRLLHGLTAKQKRKTA